MKLISGRLPFQPARCLVTGRQDGEFVDFEATFTADCDPRVYLRASLVERAAVELLGMVPQSEVEILHRKQARLEEKLIEFNAASEALKTLEAFTGTTIEEAPVGDPS